MRYLTTSDPAFGPLKRYVAHYKFINEVSISSTEICDIFLPLEEEYGIFVVPNGIEIDPERFSKFEREWSRPDHWIECDVFAYEPLHDKMSTAEMIDYLTKEEKSRSAEEWLEQNVGVSLVHWERDPQYRFWLPDEKTLIAFLLATV